jgi:hypothetical protein
MKPSELAKLARAKIADPTHWTKNVNARDANGESVKPRNDEAHCFCNNGALMALRAREFDDEYSEHWNTEEAVRDAFWTIAGTSMVAFNDDPGITHAMNLAAWDKTIAYLEAKGK